MSEFDWLVVADDLTGANDTGHQFAAADYTTRILPSLGEDLPSSDALVVNTDSRTLQPAAASAAVRDVLGKTDAKRVYKKVDSTLRGNLTAELDALIAETDTSLVIVAPAFPSGGRITVNGRHLVNEVPIDEADNVQERENPPTTSHVPTLLAGTSAPITELSLETVQAGPAAVESRLSELEAKSSTPVILVCDATTNKHLETIVTASQRLEKPPVYVGSAGLAGQLARRTAQLPSKKRVLGIVGSTNEQTFKQLRAVPDTAIVALDIIEALDDPTATGTALGTATARKLDATGVAVVTSAQTPRDVKQAYDYGEDQGLDPAEVRERIEVAMTTAIETTWEGTLVDGMFATGGTTATSALETLGIEDIRLTGDAVAEGVPVGTTSTSSGEKFTLITKAGGFGDRTTIVDCLQALGGSIDPVP